MDSSFRWIFLCYQYSISSPGKKSLFQILTIFLSLKKSRLNCKNSNKTRDAFLENGFGGPEAQYFTGIVIDSVFDLLYRFRCDFSEVCSFWEPTADHSIHIFVWSSFVWRIGVTIAQAIAFRGGRIRENVDKSACLVGDVYPHRRIFFASHSL